MTVSSLRLGALAAALVATHLVSHAAAPVPTVAPGLASLPFALESWTGEPAPPLSAEEARVLAADQYVRRYYRSGAGVVEMDVSYYSRPRVGSSMHSPLNCLPGNGWAVADVKTRPLATAAGTWDIRELIVERGASRYALSYWFQSRDRIIADEFAARFYLLADAVRRRPTDAGLVRVMMPVAGAGTSEQATLAAFASNLIPELAARFQAQD